MQLQLGELVAFGIELYDEIKRLRIENDVLKETLKVAEDKINSLEKD